MEMYVGMWKLYKIHKYLLYICNTDARAACAYFSTSADPELFTMLDSI